MSRIVLANGIWTHGEGNIDLIGGEMSLRGYKVVDVPLRKVGPLRARFAGKDDGQKIACWSQDGDILVAHSFGAVRAWYAHRYREYKAIVVIAAAQSTNAEWRNPNRVWCFHSPEDDVLKLGAALILHPFGKAGIKGYKQPGVHNVEVVSDHNDYFQHKNLLKQICDTIELIDQRMGEVHA